MKVFFQKLTDKTSTQLLGLVIISYTIFFLIIMFIFIPTSTVISETGYSTSDLQLATTSEEVSSILSEWQDIIPTVYLQYLGDFVFLISGLLGNATIFVLLGKIIKENGTLVLPFVGFVAVFLSRGFDALENTLTLILIIFPNSYPRLILSVLPIVPIIKFAFVAFVYSLMVISLLYYFLLKRRKT